MPSTAARATNAQQHVRKNIQITLHAKKVGMLNEYNVILLQVAQLSHGRSHVDHVTIQEWDSL